MNRLNVEVIVGLFFITGVACFAYIAIMLGDVDAFDTKTYSLDARFLSTSGLKDGAPIEIAGVIVGKVSGIEFDNENYESLVKLKLPLDIRLQDDSIASVRSTGLIGSKFIKITPGGSEDYLQAGDEITETEPSVSLEELISKYIFESK